jgi:hypothetical protein
MNTTRSILTGGSAGIRSNPEECTAVSVGPQSDTTAAKLPLIPLIHEKDW